MTTDVLMVLASLTPAAGTGTAGTIWLARLWLRYRTETGLATGCRDARPEPAGAGPGGA